jgi:phosphonate degradation associated HDIG domain protein
MNFIDDLEHLYTERGTRCYEIQGRTGVTQMQHALQCAALATAAGAPEALVAAALLHDLGHLLQEQMAEEPDGRRDDVHQFAALPFLRPHFPAAVLEPIKLHVAAKRYLCAIEPGYWAGLSAGSKRSLELQGGPFKVDDAKNFMSQPFAADSLLLRRWDDQAKEVNRQVPAFASYRGLLTPRPRAQVAEPFGSR